MASLQEPEESLLESDKATERKRPESAEREDDSKRQSREEEEQEALEDKSYSPWPPEIRPYELRPWCWDMPENNTDHNARFDNFDKKWRKILQDAYNEPHRHYHTLGHIQSMRDILADNQRDINRPLFDDLLTAENMHIMGLAIWFHDLVYDPTKTTPGYNEIESAVKFYDYAMEFAFEHPLWDIMIGVLHLILATITHTMPTFPSSVRAYDDNKKVQIIIEMVSIRGLRPRKILIQLFLDLDVSILAAPDEDYNTYAKQIRKEYSSFSWEEYRKGRMEVMTAFLQRERIFLTDHFNATYEQQARSNIQRELKSLQNGDENVYPCI